MRHQLRLARETHPGDSLNSLKFAHEVWGSDLHGHYSLQSHELPCAGEHQVAACDCEVG